MSKLTGKRKHDFLAHVVRQEPSVDPSIAAQLTERLDRSIRSVRVTKADLAGLKAGSPKPQKSAAPVIAKPSAAPFDPYAFNAILVFKRSGREGLAAKLAALGDPSQLRQLAEAQLIGLDQDMRTGTVDIDELREAVLRGVERLVADRRAAAS